MPKGLECLLPWSIDRESLFCDEKRLGFPLKLTVPVATALLYMGKLVGATAAGLILVIVRVCYHACIDYEEILSFWDSESDHRLWWRSFGQERYKSPT